MSSTLLDRVLHQVRPAWPDEARGMVQGPVLRRLLERSPFRGAVLNAGSGEGMYAGLLEEFDGVTRIVNCDLEAPRGILARPDRRHEAVAAPLTDLPFADATFDGVLCTEVLEHIVDDARAARELARVSKAGATLLVSVPTPPAPPDANHVREGYTLDELRRLLEPAGFVIEAHETCFFDAMRTLLPLWTWQHRVLGRGRRNLAPRALVHAFAHADVAFRLGRPWDLVALARRT
jgi:SAM-dependent methyltransferase